MIVARFVWVFPATYLPRWLIPALAQRDPSPPWQWAFVLAFTGVRGVVSLAAALAIPLTIEGGAPFPQRDLILFATFGVIIITLVGQGLMLPTVIRWLGLGSDGDAEHRARAAGRARRPQRGDPRRAAAPRTARRRTQARARRSSPSSTRATIIASG